MKSIHAVVGFLLMFFAALVQADSVLDTIEPGSLGEWTYLHHDPCSGTRIWGEVPSIFDGTTALSASMTGCGGICGSYNLYKDYAFDSPLDRNITTVAFDAEFDLLGTISHNRAQIQLSFFRDGEYLGMVLFGYDRFGESYNVPPGTYASGTWAGTLADLPDDPDMMRVTIHVRSCVGGNGRVSLDNIRLLGTGEPPACDNQDEIDELLAALDAAQLTIAERDVEITALSSEVLALEAELSETAAGLTEVQYLLTQPQGRRSTDSLYSGSNGAALNGVIETLLAPPGAAINQGKK